MSNCKCGGQGKCKGDCKCGGKCNHKRGQKCSCKTKTVKTTPSVKSTRR